MEKKEIVKYAGEIRDYFGTSDPFRIAAQLGITVEFRRYSQAVKGYYRKIFEKLYIIINENYSCKSQKIICAHELGHALLHTDFTEKVASLSFEDYDADGLELEANLFAAALLIDQELLSSNLASLDNYILRGIFEENMQFTG